MYDKEGYLNPYVAPINHNELNNTKTKDIMYSILDYCLSLSTLFDNTDHIGYFNKVNIGSKQRFNHDPNPILNLVILSYLRQLQQLFYQVGEGVQE